MDARVMVWSRSTTMREDAGASVDARGVGGRVRAQIVGSAQTKKTERARCRRGPGGGPVSRGGAWARGAARGPTVPVTTATSAASVTGGGGAVATSCEAAGAWAQHVGPSVGASGGGQDSLQQRFTRASATVAAAGPAARTKRATARRAASPR